METWEKVCVSVLVGVLGLWLVAWVLLIALEHYDPSGILIPRD